ncbi:hypothetical protein F5B19DRAFT_465685 [Rostrohypoxylon terebratum]|nr:hypothetical protein F5B19DRAFT_465685 [Rostrohypoxylon terebratum]
MCLPTPPNSLFSSPLFLALRLMQGSPQPLYDPGCLGRWEDGKRTCQLRYIHSRTLGKAKPALTKAPFKAQA